MSLDLWGGRASPPSRSSLSPQGLALFLDPQSLVVLPRASWLPMLGTQSSRKSVITSQVCYPPPVPIGSYSSLPGEALAPVA